jgi:hypothetical protein
VATVTADNKIVLKKVTLGPNHSTEVEVLQGPTPTDQVVDDPSACIEAGDTVRIADAGSHPATNAQFAP